MNRKESGGIQFKRILSHTSSGSGNAVSNEQLDCTNIKKLAKLKTGAQEPKSSGLGNNYMLNPDHEPLLHHVQPGSPGVVPGPGKLQRRIQVSPNRGPACVPLELPPHDSACGPLSPLDIRSDCQRGIMSVADIEVTMGEEVAQHSPIFLHPGSPMDESVTSTSANPRAESKCYPIQRCTKVSCDENKCLWHHSVLKLPQYVRWEDKTVTIELQKNRNESFGFHHKAKQHKGTEEIYILVCRVDKGSKAAESGLAVGDLILSVNTEPLQTKQKLSEINFKTLDNLRLQIQRPMEISHRAADHVKHLAASMEENKKIISPDPSIRMPQPVSPSTSPSDAFAHCLSPTKENIPLFTLPKTETRKLHYQLPQVRVFICGNATNEFVRCLIGDYINVHLDMKVCCFKLKMKKSADGTVSFGNSESFTYLLKDSHESCINIELVSVSDDSFFDHCCTWMFTPNSFFILTFDAKRLSQSSAVEMSRLCSLAHTVRTSLHRASPHLKIYGISASGDSIRPEEIQTLFYTSLGEPLQNPKLIPIISGDSREEMKKACMEIFDMLSSICATQQVIYQTAIALDMLVSHRALTTTRQEIMDKVVEWNSGVTAIGSELSVQVIEDLRNTGNVLVLGSVNAACRFENVKEFVVASMLFDSLSQLASYSDRDRVSMRQQDIWFTLSTSGIGTKSEILEILGVYMLDPEKLLSCMSDLRLLFPVKVIDTDSGFGESDSFLFPYVLEDISFSPESEDGYEHFLTIKFSEDVPSTTFYGMISELSYTEECQSFSMRSQYVCRLVLQGQNIYICFLKTNKQIQIYQQRSDRAEGHRKTSVTELIERVISQQIPSPVKVMLISPLAEAQSRESNSQGCPSDSGNFPVVCASTETEVKSIRISAGGSQPGSPQESASQRGRPNFLDYPPPEAPIPEDMMGAMGEGIPPPYSPQTEAELAQRQVLQMRMMDLRYVHKELHEICTQMSIGAAWETLAGYLGLNMTEVSAYESMMFRRQLPAKIFLDNYFRDTLCTFRHFLQALLMMGTNERCQLYLDMAQGLWNAALRGNSTYYQQNHTSQ